MRSTWLLAAGAAWLYGAAGAAWLCGAAVANDFESAPQESPGLSLPATEVAGVDFHVHDPVSSDGLMHH